MRVGSLRNFFSEKGAMMENDAPGKPTLCIGLAWPAEYGIEQASVAQTAFWIGSKDFFDPVMQRTYSAKVVGQGVRIPSDGPSQFFPIAHKMIANAKAPLVYVDGESASENTTYDVVDSIDAGQAADRQIVTVIHTSMGITITRRIYAFSQQYHDNYYVYDYVFKNTGIINSSGGKYEQVLKDCYFFMMSRYAFSGESVSGYNQGWGWWYSTWGRNTVSEDVGTDPTSADFKYRACLAWYGPASVRTVSDDWGCPNDLADPNDNVPDEILAAAKYAGVITLHADTSPSDPSDDLWQPRSSQFQTPEGKGMDDSFYRQAVSQYDAAQMQRKYAFMSAGHPKPTHAEAVGANYANLFGSDDGGYMPSQGYGPYTLAPGESVHIVTAEAVAGISREKNREVARNWLLTEKNLGQPLLVRPDGSATTDHNLYKDEWVWTCKDSLKQTFDRILDAYNRRYDFPKPPPPPTSFYVTSGGDRITLTWDENPSAAGNPHFDGYDIWRARGIVDAPHAVYEKIGSTRSNLFEDVTAQRSVDYYYYIVSKSDGQDNTLQPGVPLVSSKFYTMTNKPAYLRRPAGSLLVEIRVVPNPYVISKQALQFGKETGYDRIAFYGLPPKCKIHIYTERGDLIQAIDHNNGTGDEKWESVTSSRQVIVSGIYILYVEVTEDIYATEDKTASTDIVDDSKRLMFAEGAVMFHQGDLVFRKGESIYRKFAVIR
jgi:hypothetical protein